MTSILITLFIAMLVICGIAAIIVVHSIPDDYEPIEHPVEPKSPWGRYVVGEDAE